MSGTASWAAAAGALAVTLALAALAWALLRRRGGRIDSPEAAAEAAEHALAGFRTEGAVVGADGLVALAVAFDGRVAVMRRRGGRIAVRQVPWSAVRAGLGGVAVETGAPRGAVWIAGVSALDIRRLSAAPARG